MELPAATMREGAAMVLAGIERGESGSGTFRIVTPDLQERPIPDLTTVEGLVSVLRLWILCRKDLDPHLPVVTVRRGCERRELAGIAFVTHPAVILPCCALTIVD